MADITLLLALHNHQPVGNFGSVFEIAYERCYLPVLSALHESPWIKISLHHTGPVLRWLAEHHPEYLELMREMIGRGQLEVLGGGFYEPMLSVLPERDAVGQIKAMATWCDTHLGSRPRGMWLAERVWEPDLARIIHRGGMEFTLLDDTHFYNTGMTDRYLHGSYLTEKAGDAIRVLPISKDLRYAIPFQPVEDTIDMLRRIADETGRQNIGLTYGDDGEKFGLWPDTHAWVFEKGWLADFFAALKDNADWLATETLSDYLDAHAPQGLVYLPTASYEEMGHWSLPTEANRRYDDFRHALQDEDRLESHRAFVRGGIWQGFLTKYPESNAIHKRMLRVSRKLDEASRDADQADAEALETARDHLYQAQCNCAYWHGLFGGIYLNWLRSALYEHLYQAEASLDRLSHGEHYRQVEVVDIDLDGHNEITVDTPDLSLIISPHQGGGLKEIGLRKFAFNPTDVLTRRIEGFHRLLDRAVVMDRESAKASLSQDEGDEGKPKSIHDLVLAKEPNLERFIIEDPAPRHCAMGALYPTLDPEALVEALNKGTAEPLCAFYSLPFQVSHVREEHGVEVALQARGELPGGALKIDKRYVLSQEGDAFDVVIALSSNTFFSGLFALSFNLTLLAPDAPDRTLQIDEGEPLPMNSIGAVHGHEVLFEDGWRGLQMRLSTPDIAHVLHHPIETVSQSEDGFERTYQGTCLTFAWPIKVTSGHTVRFQVGFEALASPPST